MEERFVVLYRWRIKPEFEKQFIDAWTEVTKYFVENFDSLGSRLHKGSDGIYYAYAQWKSAEQRENASLNTENQHLSEKMAETIEQRFPETKLEIFADFLK